MGHFRYIGQDINYHQQLKTRLIEGLMPVTESGCWLWLKYIRPTGYGQVHCLGRAIDVHILSYELHKGPIPKKMNVCHSCDIPACLNPDHLWLGTQQDNLADMRRKGRANVGRGVTHRSVKLTPDQVLQIRHEHKNIDITMSALARVYKVSKNTIRALLSRRSWRHI